MKPQPHRRAAEDSLIPPGQQGGNPNPKRRVSQPDLEPSGPIMGPFDQAEPPMADQPGRPANHPHPHPYEPLRAARLIIPGKPLTANQHHRNRPAAEAETKRWRTRTARIWRQDYGTARIRPPAHITAWPLHEPRPGPEPDTDAIWPTLKAIIDGLQDAHALGDDNPDWVAAITLLAGTPAATGAAMMVITIETLPGGADR